MKLMGRWAFWCPWRRLPTAERTARSHHHAGRN